MTEVIEEARAYQEKIVYWRRQLHQIPELDLELPKTSAYIVDVLGSAGIQTKRLRSCSGVIGLIEGKRPGKTIALRADMDALPVKEETGLPFASAGGAMHACGHDAHMAMLLAAAEILMKHREKWSGCVKLIFQPGEERSGGAERMLAEGVFQKPAVDAVIGLHTGNLFEGIKSGQVGICYGPMMASQDHFTVKILGKGTHGAYPSWGVDPVVIAAQIITALQTIVSREVSSDEPAVLTIGKIQGGEVYNVIPGEVELEGSIRNTSPLNREKLARRIEELISFVARGMRGDYELSYTYGFPVLVNDAAFTKGFYETAAKVVGKENVVEITKPLMGSEDMAFFLEKVPGTYVFLASIPPGRSYPHHNSRFDLDENVLWRGAALLAQGALDWMV